MLQADARSKLGERCTAFEQVVNGSKTLQRGDLVRLAVKPALVGRIQFFSVAQVSKVVGTRQLGHAACAWWRALSAQCKLWLSTEDPQAWQAQTSCAKQAQSPAVAESLDCLSENKGVLSG